MRHSDATRRPAIPASPPSLSPIQNQIANFQTLDLKERAGAILGLRCDLLSIYGMDAMAKMHAMIVPEPGGKLHMEERELPEPGRHEVRIKVHACGVCHSDALTIEGGMPGLAYPRIPGHEVIGVIDAVGPDVDGWTVGSRVGVG
jgi:hypothetical protein